MLPAEEMNLVLGCIKRMDYRELRQVNEACQWRECYLDRVSDWVEYCEVVEEE